MKMLVPVLVCVLSSTSAQAATDVVKASSEFQNEPLRIAQQHAPINSSVRLQEHVSALSADSPLRALSTPARQRFVASLRFNEAGLTGYSYRDIASELSYSEAYRLLAMFGAERTLSKLPALNSVTSEDERIRNLTRSAGSRWEDDHPGYACVAKSTCSQSAQEICMTGC